MLVLVAIFLILLLLVSLIYLLVTLDQQMVLLLVSELSLLLGQVLKRVVGLLSLSQMVLSHQVVRMFSDLAIAVPLVPLLILRLVLVLQVVNAQVRKALAISRFIGSPIQMNPVN